MKKKNKKFKIYYSCNCGCEIVKKGNTNFERSKHYYIECPFCQKKMWVIKAKGFKEKNEK